MSACKQLCVSSCKLAVPPFGIILHNIYLTPFSLCAGRRQPTDVLQIALHASWIVYNLWTIGELFAYQQFSEERCSSVLEAQLTSRFDAVQNHIGLPVKQEI